MRLPSRSAISHLYWYQALSYTFFDRAIFTIYLAEKGLSLPQIGLLQSLLFIATFTAEFPMGALGDRIGRKRLVVAGRLCIVLYSILMLIGGGFPVFALAFLLFGLGEAAVSGADSALLYESAHAEGRDPDFTRIAGRFHGIAATGVAFGMLGGGVLQSVSWSAVFLASAALHLVAVGILRSVPDAWEAEDEQSGSWRSLVTDVVFGLRADHKLVVFALGAALLGSSINTLFIYGPILLATQGFSTPFVSATMALTAALAGVASMQAWRLVRRMGDAGLFVSLPVTCGLLLASVAVLPTWLVPVAVLVVCLGEDLLEPITSRVINDRVPDRIRASMLSLYSTAYSLFAVVLFPAMGWVAEHASFGVMTVVLGAACLGCVVLLPRGTTAPLQVASRQDA